MKEITEIFKDKKIIILFAAVLIGTALVAIGNTIGAGIAPSKSQNTDVSAYIKDIENRLCKTVSGISGAGNASVFVTAENTFETVYANNSSIDESGDDNKKTRTTKKELAYTTSRSDGEEPVVVKQLCPKICGVLIVCEGGSNKRVKDEIISSVSTAFNIPSNKIYVTGGNIK